MFKALIGIVAALLLAACAPMSTAPQSNVGPRIESVPGKAVIYLVRTRPDLSYLTTTIVLDDQIVGATYAGTHFRFEVAPGRHRISGYGQDNGAITLDVQADRVYFVQHSVSGSWRATSPHSFFTVLDEARGRAALARAMQAA
jgi:uncharacterized protein DUF2846